MASLISADDQVARIFAWRRGFNAIYLIDIGIRLGLFRALAGEAPSSAAAIAATLGLQERHVAVWCLTAYGLGLLEADAPDRYRLAPHIDVVLANPKHPRYLGGYVRLGTEVAADDFARASEAFRTGETTPFQGRGEAFARVVAEATAGLQVLTARKLLGELPGLGAELGAGASILEVGCGTGALLVELARAFPSSPCTGVEIDPVSVPLAQARVHEAGLGDRVRVVQGEVAAAAGEGVFACAVMVEVLHEIGPSIRQQVIDGCARALRPGGWLLVVDETYPETLAEARGAEFQFPLQTGFEELLWGNVLPTRSEQEALLRNAGLTADVRRSIVGEGFTVLAARKPQ